MVISAFWCSFIAAHKLWKYCFGADSDKQGNSTSQRSSDNRNSVQLLIKGIPFEEDRVSGIVAHHLALEDEIVSVLTPGLTFETNAVNNVNEVVVEEVKEQLALKENICEEVADISHLEETADEGGEKVKNDEILQELCVEIEQVSKIVPGTTDQTECITQMKEIPFEKDRSRVSEIVAHHLALEDKIVNVFTPELNMEPNAVNIVEEVVVEQDKELSNIQDLTLKENVCEEVADFANLQETEDEDGKMLSEEVKVDKIVQELVINKEQVSKIIPDIADVTESISQVKVAGDRVFGITHEISLKERIERKLKPVCAHGLETIEDVKEILVENSGQQFHLEKPTDNEPDAHTPESVHEVKEDHFEDAMVEHSSNESTEDKQDVRECTREDASDTEGVTCVHGEILLEEELHGNFDKTSLQAACESHTELEKHNAVEDNDVDCGSLCGCLLEEKNDLPDKNPQGVVVSGNTIEGESSTKDSCQIVNLPAQPSHNLENATSSSTKRSSLELNASAREFVPRKVFNSESCFRKEDSVPSSMKDSELTGSDEHSKSEGRLNAEAKEFVPSIQARLCENRAAWNSQP